MHYLANPGRFMRWAERLLPWLGGAFVLLLSIGLYKALYDSPPDYQQGDSVRIMYVHVPAAFLGEGGYVLMALGSFSFLVWKHPLGDLFARSVAPIGAVFTFICLVSGAIWGYPTWGTWWVWDARLTSMLILLFLYMGYMALAEAFDDPGRGQKAAAILALVGVINIPVIKFSVYFFNTLHQKSTLIRAQGPSLPSEMLTPLILMAGAMLCLFLCLTIVRLQGKWAENRIRLLRLGLDRDLNRG